ncbi:hypothetical protein L345_07366, partial [Ophiophagus hannah]
MSYHEERNLRKIEISSKKMLEDRAWLFAADHMAEKAQHPTVDSIEVAFLGLGKDTDIPSAFEAGMLYSKDLNASCPFLFSLTESSVFSNSKDFDKSAMRTKGRQDASVFNSCLEEGNSAGAVPLMLTNAFLFIANVNIILALQSTYLFTCSRGKQYSGSHYGKDIYRSGGPDFHNFISSGFVTLGRGHNKGTVETIFC